VSAAPEISRSRADSLVTAPAMVRVQLPECADQLLGVLIGHFVDDIGIKRVDWRAAQNGSDAANDNN